jgi:hypothetical protein
MVRAHSASELSLYGVWLRHERLLRPLRTADGKLLEILFPGARNYDSGPDFTRASLKIDRQLRCGDVELHRRASDWYAHGHHRDARYNAVILHVVFRPRKSDAQTLREDGSSIPVLYLEGCMLESPDDSACTSEFPQLGSGQRGKVVFRHNCPLCERSTEKILNFLEYAGELRLNEKTTRLTEERNLDLWDQLLYRGLAEALGYSLNQTAFRRLAETLPVRDIKAAIFGLDEDVAECCAQAYLFGASGLLPAVADIERDTSDESTVRYMRTIRMLWDASPFAGKVTPLDPVIWRFFRLRPHNFPTRRIAGLARLIIRFRFNGFHGYFSGLLTSNSVPHRRVNPEMKRSLIVASEGYWRSHAGFHESPAPLSPAKSPHLIGGERAQEMVVNMLFPYALAYAREIGDRCLENKVRLLYSQSLAPAENCFTETMKTQLFSDPCERAKITARVQQGLLHLYKTFCAKGYCERCLDAYMQS